METVEVVIKLPKEEYDYMIANPTRYNVCDDETLLYNHIKNGVVLPKGHGRLGDLSKIYDRLNEAQIEGTEEYKGLGEAKQIICDAPTIIEADAPKKRKGIPLEENDSGYNCENWIP